MWVKQNEPNFSWPLLKKPQPRAFLVPAAELMAWGRGGEETEGTVDRYSFATVPCLDTGSVSLLVLIVPYLN